MTMVIKNKASLRKLPWPRRRGGSRKGYSYRDMAPGWGPRTVMKGHRAGAVDIWMKYGLPSIIITSI